MSKPARMLVKWILVPAFLAMVGFFYVGPYIIHSNQAVTKKEAPKAVPDNEPESKIVTKGPEVKVDSHPANKGG